MSTAKLHIHHVGIVVPDVDRYMKAMQGVLGDWTVLRRVKNDVQQVDELFISDGDDVLEIMAPLCAGSPVDTFLKDHPMGGIAHVCYVCDNLEVVLGTLMPAAKLISGPMPDPGHGDHRVAFIFLGGQLVELVER